MIMGDPSDTGWRDENTSPRHTVRHPEATAQILAARGAPAATPDPGPVFAVDPDGIDRRCDHAMFTRGCRSCTWRVPLDAQGNAIWPDAEPSLVLTGSDLATFEAFSSAAAALEQHAEQGQALQSAYRNALQAVSAMAARRNRGR